MSNEDLYLLERQPRRSLQLSAAAPAAAESLKNAKMPNVKVPDVVPERLKQENIPSSVDPTKGTFNI